MKNIYKVIFVIIGTLIGAGFASGKEIYLFFVRYKFGGLIGIIISNLIIGMIIRKVVLLLLNKNINTYKELIEKILENKRNNDIVNIINSIVNVFLLVTFYIMIAGFSTYFKQEYNVPIIIGALIVSFFCFICLLKNVKGIVNLSNILVPIIILIIIGIGFKSLNFNQRNIMNIVGETGIIKAIISAILYASYNSIILIPTIVPIKGYLEKKNAKYVWVVASILLTILSLVVYIILINSTNETITADLPISYKMRDYGRIYEYIYGIAIISSIFTSIISAGYSFLKNVTKTRKGYTQVLTIMCITSILFSNIGFSKMVGFLYPIFGGLGIIQIYFLLKTKK